MKKITPWLWFDHQAEEAASYYTSVFEHSRILEVTHYGAAGPMPEGTVMTVAFEIDGQELVALNGGPAGFGHSEAISFLVACSDQDEVDRFWRLFAEGGGEEGPCGWVKDRYGISWQIVPTVLEDLIRDPDPERSQRAFTAMLGMTKLDIAALERAADGTA